jgi:hypothetical protein
MPSPQTPAHLISMSVTLLSLPFHLKHTLVCTVQKNGAVFEVADAGVVGDETERRNWWGRNTPALASHEGERSATQWSGRTSGDMGESVSLAVCVAAAARLLT